jgi:hypothetical protein
VILGTGVGLLWGLAYGVAGEILYSCDDQYWICDPWHVVGSFTLIGAVFGGIGGALTHSAPYKTVRLEPR